MFKHNRSIVHESLSILLMAKDVSQHHVEIIKNNISSIVLQLKKSTTEQQYLNVGNNNDYSLIYKPLSDVPSANTSLIIDISRATHRISLEEKFRLERRSNHYICKMSKFKETIRKKNSR